MLTQTTELEAVNYLLRAIGERPVATLVSTAVTKASIARDILMDESRSLQERGWSFNSEEGYPLSPSLPSNNIFIPSNALRCDPSDRSQDYVNRGTKLYNKTDHTFVFSSAVAVDIVFCLPWEELPESARKYIKIKAARVFQKQGIGAPDQVQLTETDELQARVDFLDSEVESDSPNLLKNIPALNRRINPVK